MINLVNLEKLRDIKIRYYSEDKTLVTPQELQYVLENYGAKESQFYKDVEARYDRNLEHAKITEQEKANQLTQQNNFWNKWGVILSIIISLIALIIAIWL